MCGILITSGIRSPFHHRLLGSLRRRGPDQIGFWADDTLRMAHARLAIIGLDERSIEPLENDTHVLSYNGEIYNFLEIKDRVRAAGVPVGGSNDAAVLLHAWSLWGPSILKDLHGFWAFAIYDKKNRKVSLVRDQAGIKPLYYFHNGEQLCASSLLRNVLELLEETPSLDYTALSEYVRYQFTFGEKTFLKGIRKVLPGHIVEFDLTKGTRTDTCYEEIFAPVPASETHPLSDQWIDDTRELLKECILASTISDTDFTTFCSGGLDSSLITRVAVPEITYHCNYSDPECNETFFAKQAVEGISTRLFVVNAEEEFDLVERVQNIMIDFDEPTIGSVILPLDDLLAQVKRRYKVILTGTGGDELFAGYVRYQLVRGECYQDSYRGLYGKVKALARADARFELTHTKGDCSLYNFYEKGVEDTFRDAFADCREGGDDLVAMLRFDRRYFLAGLLNIDDKMCGRHSLESRPSLLHQKLVRHVQRLHPAALLSNGELKAVLRRLASGILPKGITQRTDKMGFTTPVGTFINRSMDRIREQLEGSRFRHLYELKKMSLHAETKFSREVFGLLMLDIWLNQYVRPAAKSMVAEAGR